jgi:Glucodextranase, domain B
VQLGAASTRTLGVTVIVALSALGLAACGGTTTTTTTTGGEVSVIVTSPTSGSVIAGNSVTVRGTVSPPAATVQVQGHPAAVGNGVFTAAAELHGGRTTIDVIGSATGDVPGSTSVVVVQQGSGGGNSSGGSKTSKSSATPNVAHESPGQSNSQTPCGNQLAVGPDTTCSFGENVRQQYNSQGPGTYEVFSPVTEKTYSMTCSSGTPVVCTGGNNAAVYFP